MEFMCRNIRPLFNYQPPSTQADIHDAALQFVRKISGFAEPSEANKVVFDKAVEGVEEEIAKLLQGLVTKAPQRDRAQEIRKARELAQVRFGK